MQYLGMFDAKGSCLKVIENESTSYLQSYAMQHTTGRKKACLCDSEGKCTWMAVGTGGTSVPRIAAKTEKPIGEVIEGITQGRHKTVAFR